MDDRQVKIRVGVIAVATITVAAVLVAYTTRFELPFANAQYPLQVRVNRAPGVGPSTPVQRDGVLIGRVERVESIRGGVMIFTQIDQGQQVLLSDAVRIRPSSLLGDAVVDIVQAGDFNAPAEVAAPESIIEGRALPDPIEAISALQVNVGPAVESLGRAADAVTTVAERVNAILGENVTGEKAIALIDQANTAFESFDRTMAEVDKVAQAVNSVIGDAEVQQQLKQGLAAAPQVISGAKAFIVQAVDTITRLDAAVASAEANLKNIEGLTKPIGERGPELANLVVNALENLDATLNEARAFTKNLSQSQGTLGKLVNDPQLYNEVRTVVGNVNVILMKIDRLANQLEPILVDARIFTDKVAREPGRIVGGALQRGPGIK